jgi:hypothetical protein
MKAVAKPFVPGAHFLYGCARYVEVGMDVGSWKFFIGPLLVDFEVRGSAPVCPTCHRIATLTAIGLYALAVGVITLTVVARF